MLGRLLPWLPRVVLIPTSLSPLVSPGAGRVRWRKLLHSLCPTCAQLCCIPPRLRPTPRLRPQQTISRFDGDVGRLLQRLSADMEMVCCGSRTGWISMEDVQFYYVPVSEKSLLFCFVWPSKRPG